MKIDTSNSKRIEIQNANKQVTTRRKSNINTNRGNASSKKFEDEEEWMYRCGALWYILIKFVKKLKVYFQNFSKATLPNFQYHKTHFRSHFETSLK